MLEKKRPRKANKTEKRYDSKHWFTNACNRARAKYRNTKKLFFFFENVPKIPTTIIKIMKKKYNNIIYEHLKY